MNKERLRTLLFGLVFLMGLTILFIGGENSSLLLTFIGTLILLLPVILYYISIKITLIRHKKMIDEKDYQIVKEFAKKKYHDTKTILELNDYYSMYDELATMYELAREFGTVNILCETKNNILSREIEEHIKELKSEEVTKIYEEAKQVKEIIYKYYTNSGVWKINNGKKLKNMNDVYKKLKEQYPSFDITINEDTITVKVENYRIVGDKNLIELYENNTSHAHFHCSNCDDKIEGENFYDEIYEVFGNYIKDRDSIKKEKWKDAIKRYFIMFIIVLIISLLPVFLKKGSGKFNYASAKNNAIEYLNDNEKELIQIANSLYENKTFKKNPLKNIDYASYVHDEDFDFKNKKEYIKYDLDSQGMLGGQYYGLIYSIDKDILDSNKLIIYDEKKETGEGNNIFIRQKIKDNWFFYYNDFDGIVNTKKIK